MRRGADESETTRANLKIAKGLEKQGIRASCTKTPEFARAGVHEARDITNAYNRGRGEEKLSEAEAAQSKVLTRIEDGRGKLNTEDTEEIQMWLR